MCLIGVDEKQGVIGTTAKDPARWYSAVAAEFDSIAPVERIINVPWNGRMVAVVFETDRAPFVVSNPELGARAGVVVAREVPWRTATQIRSATRSEILRLLTPLQGSPDFDLVGGELRLFKHAPDKTELGWYLDLWLIIEPEADGWVAFPKHL